jgi:hypothetical protein
MKTLNEMNSKELLTSFDLGQGKTVDLPTFASVDGTTIRYNGLSANVTEAWKDAYLLMQLHRDLKDAPSQRQEKLFDAYSEGRLSLNHNVSNDSTVKKPLAGHYLTSAEYKANCFKLNATPDTLQQIDTTIASISSNSTKESLLKVISEIASLVVTDTQRATINTLREKEQVFAAVQNELEAIGAKVTIVNDTTIKVSIAVGNVDKAITVCSDLAFKQTNADFDAKTMSIVLTMEKEQA